MLNKQFIIKVTLFISLCLVSVFAYAEGDNGDGIGQTIQIYTRFHSFLGKPMWLFIIRDIDHDESIPYLFDIERGDNFWVAFTYGRNYLITVSQMKFETYRSRYNQFKQYKINNFCGLESNGRIIKAQSMYITINGDLSPYSDTYTCNVSTFSHGNFTIVNQ